HPNVAFIRRGFDAFNAADVDTLTELLDENVAQHMGGSNALFSGDHSGRDNVLATYGRIGEASGGSFRVKPGPLLANSYRGVGDHVDRGDPADADGKAHDGERPLRGSDDDASGAVDDRRPGEVREPRAALEDLPRDCDGALDRRPGER